MRVRIDELIQTDLDRRSLEATTIGYAEHAEILRARMLLDSPCRRAGEASFQ